MPTSNFVDEEGGYPLCTLTNYNGTTLIEMLERIDRGRLYVRYGFNSLSGFCKFLKFSKTQAQRIVTQARRL